MTALANITIAFALVFSGQNPPALKAPKSVTVGDLLVTATRVWLPPNKWVDYTSDRFHLVVVEATVKNTSERISHTKFAPTLKVKPEEVYYGNPALGHHIGVLAPNLYQLLPGEESTGGYVFEVRNGTTAVALILDSFGKKLSIDLTGVVQSESPKPARPDAN